MDCNFLCNFFSCCCVLFCNNLTISNVNGLPVCISPNLILGLIVNPIFDNKDYLNSKIKYREAWRPYAPMVIEEETKKWFDLPVDKSPHMLFNSFVVEDKRKQIPSVVHVDGSARVQTVSKSDNEKIYTLLHEFFKEAGVPVLLNTSFNVKGEPIVESPTDAVNTFIKSNIDKLVMHNYYCWKE